MLILNILLRIVKQMGFVLSKPAICPPAVADSDYIVPIDSVSSCSKTPNGYYIKNGSLRPDFPVKQPSKFGGVDNCPTYSPPPPSKSFPCATNVIDFCNTPYYLQKAGYASTSACVNDIVNKANNLPQIECEQNYAFAEPKIQRDSDGVWKVVEIPTLITPGVPPSNCNTSLRKTPVTIDPNTLAFCQNSYYAKTAGYASSDACISDLTNYKSNVLPKIPCQTKLEDDVPKFVKNAGLFQSVQKPVVINDGYPPNRCSTTKQYTTVTVDPVINSYCSNAYFQQKNGFTSKDNCILSLLNNNVTTLPNVDCNVTYVDDSPKYAWQNGGLVTIKKPQVVNDGYPSCNPQKQTIPTTVDPAVNAYCNNPYYLQQNGWTTAAECIVSIYNNNLVGSLPSVKCDYKYVDDTPKYVKQGTSFASVTKPIINNQGYPTTNCPTEKQYTTITLDPALTSYCINPYYLQQNGFASRDECLLTILNRNSIPPNVNCNISYSATGKIVERNGQLFTERTATLTNQGYPPSCNLDPKYDPYTPPQNTVNYCSNPYNLKMLGYLSTNSCITDIINNKAGVLSPINCETYLVDQKPAIQRDSADKAWYRVQDRIVSNLGFNTVCNTGPLRTLVTIPQAVNDYCNNNFYLSQNNYNSKDDCISDLVNNKANTLPAVACDVSYSNSIPAYQLDQNGVWNIVQDPTIVNPGFPVTDCKPSKKYLPLTIDSVIDNYCSNPYYRQKNGYNSYDDCVSTIYNVKNKALPNVGCNITYAFDQPKIQFINNAWQQVELPTVANDGYPPNSCNPQPRLTPVTIRKAILDYCANPYYLAQNKYASEIDCVSDIVNNRSDNPNDVSCKTSLVPASPYIQKRNNGWVTVMNRKVDNEGYPTSNCDLNDVTDPVAVPNEIQSWCNNPYYRSSQNFADIDSCITSLLNSGSIPNVRCSYKYSTATPKYDADEQGNIVSVENGFVDQDGYPPNSCKPIVRTTPVIVPPELKAYCGNPYYLSKNNYSSSIDCMLDILNNKNNQQPNVDCEVEYKPYNPLYQLVDNAINQVYKANVVNNGFPPEACDVSNKNVPTAIPTAIRDWCNNPYYLNQKGFKDVNDCVLQIMNSPERELPKVDCLYTYTPQNPKVQYENGSYLLVEDRTIAAQGYPTDSCSEGVRKTPIVIPTPIASFCSNNYFRTNSGYASDIDCVLDLINQTQLTLPSISCTGTYVGATPNVQLRNGQWMQVHQFVPTQQGNPADNCSYGESLDPITISEEIATFCNNPYFRSESKYNSVTDCISDIVNNKDGILPSVSCKLKYTNAVPRVQKDTDGVWKQVEVASVVNTGNPPTNCDLSPKKTTVAIDTTILNYCNNPYYLSQNNYSQTDECISDIVNNLGGKVPNVPCGIDYINPKVVYRNGQWLTQTDASVINPGYPTNSCDLSSKYQPYSVSKDVSEWCNNKYYTSQRNYPSVTGCIDDIINNKNSVLPNVACNISYSYANPKYIVESGQVKQVENATLVNAGYPTNTCDLSQRKTIVNVDSTVVSYCDNPYYRSKNGYISSLDCQADILNKGITPPPVECDYSYSFADPRFYVDNSGNWFSYENKRIANNGYPAGGCNTRQRITPVNSTMVPNFTDIQNYCSNPYFLTRNGYADSDSCIYDILNNLNYAPNPVVCTTQLSALVYKKDTDGVWKGIRTKSVLKQGYPTSNCDLNPVKTAVDATTMSNVNGFCENTYWRSSYANLKAKDPTTYSKDDCISDLLNLERDSQNNVVIPSIPCETTLVNATPYIQKVGGQWVAVKDKIKLNDGYNSTCALGQVTFNKDVDPTSTAFLEVDGFCKNDYLRTNNDITRTDTVDGCISKIINQYNYVTPSVNCNLNVVNDSPYYQLDSATNKWYTVKRKDLLNEGWKSVCDVTSVKTEYPIPENINNYCNNPYYRTKNGFTDKNSCIDFVLNYNNGTLPPVDCTFSTAFATPKYSSVVMNPLNGNLEVVEVSVRTLTATGYATSCDLSNQTRNIVVNDGINLYCSSGYIRNYWGYTSKDQCILDIYNKQGGITSLPSVPCDIRYNRANPAYVQQASGWKYVENASVANIGVPAVCDVSSKFSAYTVPQDVADFCANATFRSNARTIDLLNNTSTAIQAFTGADNCTEKILNSFPGTNPLSPSTNRLQVNCVTTSGFNNPRFVLDAATNQIREKTNYTLTTSGYGWMSGGPIAGRALVQAIKQMTDGTTVYCTSQGGVVYMVNEQGVAKSYVGTIDSFSAQNWANYTNAVGIRIDSNYCSLQPTFKPLTDPTVMSADTLSSMTNYCANNYWLTQNGYANSTACMLDILNNKYNSSTKNWDLPLVTCTGSYVDPTAGLARFTSSNTDISYNQVWSTVSTGYQGNNCYPTTKQTTVAYTQAPYTDLYNYCNNPWYRSQRSSTSINDTLVDCVRNVLNNPTLSARYIRVEKVGSTSTSNIYLSKVQAWNNTGLTNLALGKAVTSSSVGVGTLASVTSSIDGTNFGTNTSGDQWLEVDLLSEQIISKVVIVNSFPASTRCMGCVVKLLDAARTTKFTYTIPTTATAVSNWSFFPYVLANVNCEIADIPPTSYLVSGTNVIESKPQGLVSDSVRGDHASYPTSTCWSTNSNPKNTTWPIPTSEDASSYCADSYIRSKQGYASEAACWADLLNKGLRTQLPNVICNDGLWSTTTDNPAFSKDTDGLWKRTGVVNKGGKDGWPRNLCWTPTLVDGCVGYYDGSSFNTTTRVWSDISGKNNHVPSADVVGPIVVNTVQIGSKDAKPRYAKILTGNTSCGIVFPTTILPQTYTLFTVARYNPVGTARGRIFDGVGSNVNWLSGFHSANVGVAYHPGWIAGYTATSSQNITNWFIGSDINNGYWMNGENKTTNSTQGSSARLSINNGSYSCATCAERSDWQVALVLVYNRNLSDIERRTVESWISDTYGIALASSSTYVSPDIWKKVELASSVYQNTADIANYCKNSYYRSQYSEFSSEDACVSNILNVRGGIIPGVQPQYQSAPNSTSYIMQNSKVTRQDNYILTNDGYPPGSANPKIVNSDASDLNTPNYATISNYCANDYYRSQSFPNKSVNECILDVINTYGGTPPNVACTYSPQVIDNYGYRLEGSSITPYRVKQNLLQNLTNQGFSNNSVSTCPSQVGTYRDANSTNTPNYDKSYLYCYYLPWRRVVYRPEVTTFGYPNNLACMIPVLNQYGGNPPTYNCYYTDAPDGYKSGKNGMVRTIKLTQPNAVCLNIGEIRVYDASNNLIPIVTGNSSSNFNGSFPATNLWDNNNNSFAHTNCEAGGWFQVDLGSDKPVAKVIITNRQDCCQDRAVNVVVTLANSAGTVMYKSVIKSIASEYTIIPVYRVTKRNIVYKGYPTDTTGPGCDIPEFVDPVSSSFNSTNWQTVLDTCSLTTGGVTTDPACVINYLNSVSPSGTPIP